MRQYSRWKNLSEKEHNTKYFHTIASTNRKRNLISRINVRNEFFLEVDSITRGIRNHFKNFYHDTKEPESELPTGVFKQFNEVTRRALETIPKSEEIEVVIWSCDPDKAPGHDGFNERFIKEMWETIWSGFISFVTYFFTSGEFP